MCGFRRGREARGPDPPPLENHGFLRNTGTESLEEQSNPLDPSVSRGRTAQPSVKYVDD